MATITTANLIAKFQYALDNKWGYVLNTWHTLWTQAMQNSLVSQMRSKYGDNWKSTGKGDKNYWNAYYCGKWVGHYVTDCSGLFYWAFKELGGYMYHGSNTMWKSQCTSKGTLSGGKRTDGKELKPGTAVFVTHGSDRSHVGLYIGGGKVIEASGQDVGVTTSDVSNKKWAEWGELKGVTYSGSSEPTPAPAPTPIPADDKPSGAVGSAVVNAVRVALRTGPSTSATILTRVDKGERVQVLDDEWTRVTYQGKTGYMMSKFLTR